MGRRRPRLRTIDGGIVGSDPPDRVLFSLVHARERIDVPASAVAGIEALGTITFWVRETGAILHFPQPRVEVQLSQAIRERIEALTRQIVGESMDIVVGGEIVTSPIVREPLGAQSVFGIAFYDDLAGAHALAQRLRSGWRTAGPRALDVTRGWVGTWVDMVMARGGLRKLTVQQLVVRFMTIAPEQHEVDRARDAAKYNRLCDELDEVEQELKGRDGDQRRALIALHADSHPQVQSKAIAATRHLRFDKLASLTVDELVDRFVMTALGQHNANRVLDTARYNKLYDRMDRIKRELKDRDGDQRRALIPLYSHVNAQVRLKAAIATLALAPEAARQTLQRISDRNEYPEAAYARGMLRALDEGTFVPN